jgi:membrane protein implicated in regulation of membrane protease activity
MATLYEVIVGIVAKQTRPGTPTGPTSALYQPGTVTAVNADGTYAITVGGRTVTANPETDLPLAVGQAVYVSEVRNGKPVVHGPR